MPIPGQAAPQGQPQQGGGDQLSAMVEGIGSGLQVIQEMAGKTNPEAAQYFQAAMQAFTQGISILGGGPGAQGAAPQETGSNFSQPA